ncbi:MAG: mannitol dehydrogenase family protein [Actinomyces sp.]|uniref:mannitol dehydrogenase family protein n=1 Tax=Actinomyces sp. TaxID=29317 RepID=UPI0026DD6A82|nr:mannitol dehydrogenase family protein [Actinomyces sp.]MDO4244268.1 mannitol dehydrogenase family protein [Actinomyces sp.]
MTANDALTTVPPHLSALAPPYDRRLLTTGIVHIGVGGFHRAHQAMYLDRLMRDGLAMDWGVCGVGLLPADARMRDALAGQDHTYSLTLKHPGGRRETSVIGSLRAYLFAPEDPTAVLAVMSDPATRIVSLTITEGGYQVDDDTGTFRTDSPGALHDAAHPDRPTTAFGYIVAALRRRRDAGIPPFTVMSCDNLPGNGRVARTAVVTQAAMSDPEMAAWIEEQVAFPNSMVDRITPVTTLADVEELAAAGIDDAWPVTCEPFTQWVLEDDFPAGRPPLERAGVQMVEDVVPYELIKLRLLNASHQGLAHWGRLLGIRYAHEAATDPDIAAWVRAYLEREALPRLRPVPGIDLGQYVDTLAERFANEAIADTLARLAQDASSRMPKFVLPTVRDNLATGGPVRLGAAMVAAWALGDEGVDELGEPIPVDDPAGAGLLERAARQREEPGAFVGDQSVFGDLADDQRFTEVFVAELTALRTQGARTRMRALVAGG